MVEGLETHHLGRVLIPEAALVEVYPIGTLVSPRGRQNLGCGSGHDETLRFFRLCFGEVGH